MILSLVSYYYWWGSRDIEQSLDTPFLHDLLEFAATLNTICVLFPWKITLA